MISAVAARKAAREAQGQQEQQAPSSTLTQQPPQTPKRKPPSQRTKPPSKKQKRDSKQPGKSLDAFRSLPDISGVQEDVIIIDSDSDEPKQDDLVLSEESDIEMQSAQTTRLRKRAWSPSTPFHDQSSDEDIVVDVSGLIDLPTRVQRPETTYEAVLSTFRPIAGQNIFPLSPSDVMKLGLGLGGEMKSSLLSLAEGESLCLLGTCRLVLLRGSLAVNGVKLCPSSTRHSIFAPRSSTLPVIQSHGGTTQSVIDPTCLPPSLESLFAKGSALVLIQELRVGIENLGLICRTFHGVYEPPNRAEDSISSPFQLNGLYLVGKQTRELSPFVMPQSWETSLQELPLLSSSTSDPVFLIKGPKKCGKSTFARTLLNTLLPHYQRVAFLDCDPGQSEFTPGGFVSLNVVSQPVFGPPYTHPTLPHRAHFIGATTPKSSPSAYLDGVKDLIETWKVDIRHTLNADVTDDERVAEVIPLVVNTMGWSKGLGVDLMQKIEEMVEPEQVYAFQVDDGFSYSNPLESSSRHGAVDSSKTRILEPAPPSMLSTSYLPADHRVLSLLSYFHATFPSPQIPSNSEPGLKESITAYAWDTRLPLCAAVPYEVDIHTALDQIILTGAGSEDVIPNELGRVLNGALVGFIRLDRQAPYQTDSEPRGIPYIQSQPPPFPSESSCIGLGLIRGVSFPPTTQNVNPSSRATLHILTPVPPHLLTGARILVKGEIELPVWGMLDFREFGNGGDTGGVAGVEKGRVPYLQWGRGSEGAIGAERRRVRRNLMRRGQA